MSEQVNSTTEKCFDTLPTARELFHALEIEHKIVLIVSILFTALTLLAYSFNLRRVIKENVKPTKSNVATLISIYPVSFCFW